MNIRNWATDRIMQLPDCCFGRRWPVGVYAGAGTMGTHYDISEAGLGDKCVIWSLALITGGASTASHRISLAMGDVLPTTLAQFDAFEPLFSDLGMRGAARRSIYLGAFGIVVNLTMRQPVMAQGRRLVGLFEIVAADIVAPQAIIEVSSFPTEVPDWLISGQGRGQ